MYEYIGMDKPVGPGCSEIIIQSVVIVRRQRLRDSSTFRRCRYIRNISDTHIYIFVFIPRRQFCGNCTTVCFMRWQWTILPTGWKMYDVILLRAAGFLISWFCPDMLFIIHYNYLHSYLDMHNHQVKWVIFAVYHFVRNRKYLVWGKLKQKVVK